MTDFQYDPPWGEGKKEGAMLSEKTVRKIEYRIETDADEWIDTQDIIKLIADWRRMKEALEFYVDAQTLYEQCDGGKTAREALGMKDKK